MFVTGKKPTVDTSKEDELYNREVSTYDELTIKVLDILEHEGINIYSEDNYGGMYLKQRNNDMSSLFANTKPSKQTESDDTTDSDVAESDLISFFK